MMSLRTFGVNELIAVYGGFRITGWADGEFLTVELDSDIYNEANGADGEVARVKSGKLMATATVRLLQTSPINDAFSALLIEDIALNKTQPFIVKDLTGTTILDASQCYIKKFTNVTYATDVTNREWTIKIPKLLTFVGGNFRN